MKLEVALDQFLKEIKRFDSNIANSSFANKHYSQKEAVELTKEHFINVKIDAIEFLKIGELYKKSNEQRKKIIGKHITQINKSYSDIVPDEPEEEKKELLETIMNNPILFWQQNMHMLPFLAKLIITDEAKDLLNEIVEKYSTNNVDEIPIKMKEFVNNQEDFTRVYKYILQVLETLKTTLKI
jgi:hypothetical protein